MTVDANDNSSWDVVDRYGNRVPTRLVKLVCGHRTRVVAGLVLKTARPYCVYCNRTVKAQEWAS